jgi:pilus assembly protein CpaB
MDRRFLTVLGVSLVFALVVSSVFYQMTAHSGSSSKAAESTQKDVVVATRPLGVGVMVRASDIKVVKIPGDAFPKGAFAKVEDVLERPVISNILLDEPILEGRLAVRGSGLGLAPTIPVGMRAVSVRVNDVAGVAGFVIPGMHVDVLVTGKPPNGEGDMTSTCLQNILVLSAGQTIQPDARGQAMPAPTVTLLVTPDQAETLTLAGADGKIQLVLRNSSDQTMEKTPGRYVGELYTGQRQPVKPVPVAAAPARPRTVVVVKEAPAAPAAPAPPPPPDQVVVIRGNVRSVETIPNGTSTRPPGTN